MATLYEILSDLCKNKGIKGGRMCTDLGISKSLMTDLKSGRKKTVNVETAQKIASYFNVTVGYLLGEEETTKEEETINETLSDIILTLSNDDELLNIVENITKLDAEKRNVLKSFLGTFLKD